MTSLKIRVSLIAFVLGAYLVLPVGASQGRGGGPPQPPPPAFAPVIALNVVPADCYSGPGCLDPSFGTLGLASADVGGVLEWGLVNAIQADGKIVVAGVTANATPQYDRRWVIGRFWSDGTVDTSFATNGFLNFDPNPNIASLDQARKVAVQSDGKILVAGFASGSSSSSMVMRLTNTGALDSSFGVGGKFTASVGGVAQDMVLQPDGKILVAEAYSQGFRVFRLNTNGTIDTRFGTNGYRQILYSSSGGPDSIALQSTGDILVSGQVYSSTTDFDYVVTRLTSSGNWDTKFGNKGFAVVDFLGFFDRPQAMEIAADDSIVLAGWACTTASLPYCNNNMAFARLTSSGAMSASFGVGGRLTFDISGREDAMNELLIQTDGRILFAGSSGPAGTSTGGFALVGRMMANGTLDTSFGAGGVAATAGPQPKNLWSSMQLDANGLISLIGYSFDESNVNTYRWLLGRYFR